MTDGGRTSHDGSGPTIREAGVADAAAIAGVHVRGWRWGYRGLLPERFLAELSVEGRERMWRAELASGGALRVWLLEDGGRALAFVACGPARDRDVPERTGEIYAIYREEDARGTAGALLRHAADDLRVRGFERAVLWVLEENTRARRFYEREGWPADGSTKTEELAGAPRREIRHWRHLG